MNVLSIKNLSILKPNKQATPVRLLNNVNCEINAGEITCVIGPNGAGKSTLLKAIAGDWQFQGEIEMPRFVKDEKIKARQIAMLSQFSLLNFPFRVHEVVGLARIPHQTGYQRDQQIIDEALQLMDISSLKHRLYTELSGGEKQRVQLARVFAQIWEPIENQPRLLLLDEPTTALDLGHQQDLIKAIRHFAKRGVAVLMVLHDINLAVRYADRLLALLGGEQIAFGSTSQVITVENIKRLFNIDVDIIKNSSHPFPIIIGQ